MNLKSFLGDEDIKLLNSLLDGKTVNLNITIYQDSYERSGGECESCDDCSKYFYQNTKMMWEVMKKVFSDCQYFDVRNYIFNTINEIEKKYRYKP